MENPFIFYIDHQALKYLVSKPLHCGRICRWFLLFQEFEFEVDVQLGHTNIRPNHLSRIQTSGEPLSINDDLLDAHLFKVKAIPEEFADISQFL